MLVELIAHTNDPERTIAAAAKLCYSDAHIDTLLEGLTPEKTAAFLQKLSDVGHASPIEHASFTFGIVRKWRTEFLESNRLTSAASGASPLEGLVMSGNQTVWNPIVRRNLMNEKNYTPYCGSVGCRI